MLLPRSSGAWKRKETDRRARKNLTEVRWPPIRRYSPPPVLLEGRAVSDSHRGGRYVYSAPVADDHWSAHLPGRATTGGDAIPAPRRRHRRGEVPATCGCAAGDDIHYAVKANPEPALLAALHAAGSKFDVASPAEVDATLSVGASASDLVHSNPVTRRSDLCSRRRRGSVFVVDSLGGDREVASAAPAPRCCAGWSPLARVRTGPCHASRLLDRTGGRGAAVRGEGRAGRGGVPSTWDHSSAIRRVGGADRGERPRVRAPRCRGVPAPAAGPRRWLPANLDADCLAPRSTDARSRGCSRSISALGVPPPWSSRGAASPPTPVS